VTWNSRPSRNARLATKETGRIEIIRMHYARECLDDDDAAFVPVLGHRLIGTNHLVTRLQLATKLMIFCKRGNLH